MAQLPNMNWMGDQPTGSAYDVYQYYLGGGSPGGTTPTSGGGIMQTIPPYLQPGGGGGGGGGDGGYGLFGNLDESKNKMFDKNVWSDVDKSGKAIGPPGQFDWTPHQVEGFYNPQTKQYQTYEGKNIQHGGINIQPMFASLLGLGKKGPQPGDIEGTFTKGLESGKGKIKEGWEEEKDKWSKIFGHKKRKAKKEEKLQKEIADYNERKWKEAQAEKQATLQQQVKQQAAANKAAGTGGWQSGMAKDEGFMSGPAKGEQLSDVMGSFAEGGMIKDLSKDPEYRGWKKMYEANPGVGSMHEKHSTFIKFYKQHERDKKKFGGLAGLLYG